MPVTQSAKRALRISVRRHIENLRSKALYKKAVKLGRKAIAEGSETATELMSKAQSALDTAAKNNTIHRNKASRLKSRMAKAAAKGGVATEAPAKKAATKKPAAKKAATKKATK